MTLKQVKIYNILENRKSPFCDLIPRAAQKANEYLDNIKILFSTYTDHSIEHSFRVANHMYDLMHVIEKIDDDGNFIINNKSSKINDLELVLMLYAAFFHDIGMFVSDNEQKEIVSGSLKPVIELDFNKIKNNLASGDEKEAVRVIIRNCHARRSQEIINSLSNNNIFTIPDHYQNFSREVANLCWSHQASIDSIKSMFNSDINGGMTIIGDYEINLTYVSILLRLADLMDIDVDRAPEDIYNLLNIGLYENSKYHWSNNIAIKNSKKVRICERVQCDNCPYDECINLRRQIYFSIDINEGNKEYKKVQRSIISYCDYVQKELSESNHFLQRMHFDKRYWLNMEQEVLYSSQEGVINYKNQIDYNTIVKLLLGEKIYGERRVGLREIIQNSIDACKFFLKKNPDIIGYAPTVRIIMDSSTNTVIVEDNGVGMSRETVEKYFLQIGKSLYSSDWYKGSTYQFKNTGYYGIGFFAAFMLSNNVTVITKEQNSKGLKIEVSSDSEYATIYPNYESTLQHGTQIIFEYKSFEEFFKSPDDVRYYLEMNFLKNINEKDEMNFFVGENNKSLIKCNIGSTGESIRKREFYDQVFDISSYFVETECIIRSKPKVNLCWYKFCENEFLPCTFSELLNYNEITYLKIVLDEKNPFYLFIPKEIDQDPFYYDGVDRQRVFSFEKEKIYADCSLFDFFNKNKIEASFDRPHVAFIGKFQLKVINNNLYYFKINKEFENSEPDPSTVLVGKQYTDKIFIRNVLIPDFHLSVPYLLSGSNDYIIPELNKITININHEGIIPNIDRKNVPFVENKKFSYAVGRALLLWNRDNNINDKDGLDILIHKIYGDDNIFFKQGL